MNVDRYLALIGVRSANLRIAEAIEAAERIGLRIAFESEELVVLIGPATQSLPLDSGGIVVGTVHPRSAGATRTDLAAGARNTGGESLLGASWGDYVAFVRDPTISTVDVLRAPSSGLHAYRFDAFGLTGFASDVDIPLQLGLISTAIDWSFVEDHVAFPHLRSGKTGLADLAELLPGERATVTPTRVASRSAWSPWAFATPDLHADAAELAAALHRAIIECTTAIAKRYDAVLLELSGGLDSSIVAASLAGKADVHAINLVTPTQEGDERRYAERVAAHFDMPVYMAMPEEQVDLTAPLTMRSPRPGAPGVLRGWERAFITAAGAIGADVFFSGSGGDNVFCSLGSAAPVADALLTRGARRRVLATIGAVAAVHQTTVWDVTRRGLRQVRRSRVTPPWPRAVTFLAPGRLPEAPPLHPWLIEPAGALPGKRSHIRSIIAAQAHLDGFDRHAIAPSAFPLLAQPVVEDCLAIPTWTWVNRGQDRAIARDAFRDRLPAGIADRQTKGMMNLYCGTLFQANRRALAALLLDGHLAEHGLIDRACLATYLDQRGPVRDIDFYGVLALADVETWLRSWA